MQGTQSTKGRRTYHAVKILIIKDFLLSNTNKDHYVTSSDIIQHLESYGIRADRKTIFADIDRLEYDYGMKIDRVRKKGYRALEPPFEENELRLMVDSVQSAKFITQKEARAITEKIKKLSDVYIRPTLDRTSYVGERIRNMEESVVSNADLIYEAIAWDNQISFKYAHISPNKERKKYSKKGTPYVVSPFALYWSEGNYYLYAYLSDKADFRFFRIDRMERIQIPLQSRREGEELFKIARFTNKRKHKIFRMFQGPEFIVKVRFQNRFADAVIDEFGRDMMLIPCDKDHFEVNLPVQVSPPFYSWISMFGKDAQILSPSKVVEEMRRFSENVYDMYH